MQRVERVCNATRGGRHLGQLRYPSDRSRRKQQRRWPFSAPFSYPTNSGVGFGGILLGCEGLRVVAHNKGFLRVTPRRLGQGHFLYRHAPCILSFSISESLPKLVLRVRH